jgi:hypothetical protein
LAGSTRSLGWHLQHDAGAPTDPPRLDRTLALIVAAALKLRREHLVIDGETVVLERDGVSDFDALHSRKHDKRAQIPRACEDLVGVGPRQSAEQSCVARRVRRYGS